MANGEFPVAATYVPTGDFPVAKYHNIGGAPAAYPDCLYLVTNPATWNPATFTPSEIGASDPPSVNDRILCATAGNLCPAGIYPATSGTAAVISNTGADAVREGARVRVIRAPGNPEYVQTAATGAGTAVFEPVVNPLLIPPIATDAGAQMTTALASLPDSVRRMPGTHTHSTAVALNSKLHLDHTPDTVLASTMAQSASANENCIYANFQTSAATGLTLTVQGNPGDRQLTLSAVTSIVKGTRLLLANGNQHVLPYKVAANPIGLVVLLEQCLVDTYPTASTTISAVTDWLEDTIVDGKNARAGGTGDRTFEFEGAQNIQLINWRFDSDDGVPNICWASFDNAGANNWGRNLIGINRHTITGGSADITASGLYGGSSSLDGLTIIMNDGNGAQTLTLDKATNVATKAALLAAIAVKWPTIVAEQGGTATVNLKLTRLNGKLTIGSGSANTALGLTATDYQGMPNGLFSESQKNGGYENCVLYGAGYQISDANGFTLRNCVSFGAQENGAWIYSQSGGGLAIDVTIEGGQYGACKKGIYAQTYKNLTVVGARIYGCIQAGLYTGGTGNSGTNISRTTVYGYSGTADNGILHNASGGAVNYRDCAYIAAPAGVINSGTVQLETGCDGSTYDNFRLTSTGTTIVIGFWIKSSARIKDSTITGAQIALYASQTGTTISVDHCTLGQTASSGQGCLIAVAGTRVIVGGGTTMAIVAAGIALDLRDGSVLEISDFTLSGGASGTALKGPGSGHACVRMGKNVNLASAGTYSSGNLQLSTGTIQLNGATPVTYAFTDITATDKVSVERTTSAGTPATFTWAISAGVGVVITGTASDTSTVTVTIG